MLTVGSARLTGTWMASIILPGSATWLWLTLGVTAFFVAICLPSCASLLSASAADEQQGQVMGNNQALQVGAEAASGLLAGILARFVVHLPLVVLAAMALLAGAILKTSRKPPLMPQSPSSGAIACCPCRAMMALNGGRHPAGDTTAFDSDPLHDRQNDHVALLPLELLPDI
jgi:hypothetical protein